LEAAASAPISEAAASAPISEAVASAPISEAAASAPISEAAVSAPISLYNLSAIRDKWIELEMMVQKEETELAHLKKKFEENKNLVSRLMKMKGL
jgi:hypothetical protein